MRSFSRYAKRAGCQGGPAAREDRQSGKDKSAGKNNIEMGNKPRQDKQVDLKQ